MSVETQERGFFGGEHGKKSNFERLSDAFHLGKELLDIAKGQKHPNSLTPGRPPSSASSALPSPYEQDLSSAMNNMNISTSSAPMNGGQAPFIGGFSYAPSNAAYDYSAPPPAPSMPVPYGNGTDQYLTMQYALANDNLSPTPFRPQTLSASVSTGGGIDKIKPPNGGQPAPGRASSVPPPSTLPPVSPKPSRRKSSDESVQCAGYTKSGPRCTRQVKAGPGYDPELYPELFCHQHTKEVNKQVGFTACKDGGPKKWVEFKDFIPAYLQEETQAALRSEMSKPRSSADVPGYIYTYQIINRADPDNNSTEIALKVGRAVKLNKRIDEWTKQCASKTLELQGFWPENLEDEDGNRGPKLKGMVKAGDPAGWCHKLERLIHLELGDLILNEAYLEKEWPKCEPPEKKSKKVVKKACPDCRQIHKEIFTFTRPTKGKLVGKEFEKIVWPVIKRWGDFVVDYV